MTKTAYLRRRAQHTLGAGFLASSLLTASAASAALPAALDRVPTDALAVVVSPSVDRLDKNAAALLTAIEMPTVTSPAQLLSVVGLSRGVDTAKPVALVLMAGNMGGDVPPALLLLPVSDYAAVASSLSASDTTGALTGGTAAGEAVFIKKLDGGYAAVSPMRSILEGYSGEGGMLAAHEKALGAMGVNVVENSDAALIANIPALAPMLEPGMEQLKGQLGAMTMMQGGMAQGLNDSPLDMAMQNFVRDGKVGVLGLKASGMGLTASLAATFKEGSELAKIFQGGGDSTPLLKKLPDVPFLFAYAVDLSSPTARTIIGNTNNIRETTGQAMPAVTPGMAAFIDNLSGQSGMIMPNPAGLMGGLLARGVSYYASPTPDALVSQFNTIVTDLNGKTINGQSFSGVFNADSTKIGSQTVSGYSLRMKAAPGSMAAGLEGAMYGPTGGPSGFVAKTGSGVIVTTTPDQSVMSITLAAAEGKNALGGNRMLSQVQANLPSERIFEAYISPRPIIDQAAPFLAMMGQPLDQGAVPAEIPPVGLSVSVDEGAMRFDAFIPAPVIKTGISIAQSLQGLMPQRGGQVDDNTPPF